MSENNKKTQEVSTDKKNTNTITKHIERKVSDNCGKIVVYTDTVNININCCK